MYLPQDALMLMSVINTKLRDSYASLEELCGDFGVSISEITEKLEAAGYKYDSENNCFREK